ncbi:MAG: EAL domain-containing protein [Pseudomonadota bacterium]|nr:EAL domain-containing protein [Pseudomonadota bacterium]
MKTTEPLHLIIVDPSQNVAEELVSELRNAGYATRAQHAGTAEDLEGAMGRQRWDLMICRRDANAAIDPAEAIALVRQADADFPILLLEDGTDIERLTSGLQIGATDVLLLGEDDRFMLVLKRELDNLAERRGRRNAELAMKESERRNQLLLETSRAAIAYVHEGMHIYCNKAYAELFGYGSAEDLAAIPLLDMISPAHQTDFRQRLKQFDVEESSEAFGIEGVRHDNSTFEGEMSLSVAAYDGESCMQVLIRRQNVGTASTREIEQIRSRDVITGLLNRPFFIEAIDQAAEDAQRKKGDSALLQIELDNAERQRQEVGLSGFDQVLRDVGEAIAGVCTDGAAVARMGDETFGILQRGLSRDAAAKLGDEIRKVLQELLASADKKTVRLTACVGVTIIGEKTGSASAALEQTYNCFTHLRKKHADGNAVYVYDPADFITAPGSKGAEDDERAREVLRLLTDGIKNNSLVLLYQPIVSLRGEEREHYEVYLRLPDNDGNLLRPDEFIQLAEQAGMGGRIDRWVVLNAVKKVSQQRADGHDTRVTINLTHAALTDDSFLPWLRVALKAAKLPKEVVILQYSENAAATYLKQAKVFGEALKDLDCRLGLSHFGCSVDPLGTLRHLSVDFVKLDGSFVHQLDTETEKQQALSEMIRGLEGQGKITVVPMVSNANVLASLFSSGANYVQGNYLAEPSREADFEFDSGF